MEFIDTKVSALGPHKVSPGATLYDYIEIIDNGQAIKIDNVVVTDSVDAGLQAGITASFYMVEMPINPNAKFLLAMEVNGIKRIEKDPRKEIAPPSMGRKVLTSVFPSSSFVEFVFWWGINLFFGVPAIILLISKLSATKKENEYYEKALAVISKAETAGFRF